MKVSYRGRRQKGSNFERATVKLFQDAGIASLRMPLSGGDHSGKFTIPQKVWAGFDVSIPMLGRECKAECKHHASGFSRLYAWLKAPVDLLIVRSNHKDPLVVMPIKLLIELIAAAEAKKGTMNDVKEGGTNS